MSQFAGSFSQSFFKVGFRYLWKISSLPLLCGWYGAENILSIPSCCKTWSMRLFFNSILLSDNMYHGHMCTGKYSLINVETIVSADLSGIGNASGHLVRWSIMVKMCLLPEVNVSHSVTRSIAILSNGLSGISIICRGVSLNFGFLSLARYTICNVFPNVFIHSFPEILSFN